MHFEVSIIKDLVEPAVPADRFGSINSLEWISEL